MTEGTVVAPASGEQGTSIATSAQWDPLPTALGKAALRRGRFLVVGHSYVLRIHQQKLEALARLCGAIGVLAPSNWRNREGLFDGRPLQFEAASQVLHAYQGRVLRPGHIASHLYDPLALGRALAGLRPDLVQVDQEVYAFSSAQVALAAKAIGAKVAVFGWENLDRPIHPLQRVARRIVFRLADAIVCGNTEGAALVRKWGFQGRIAVVPQLGVDPELFKPRPRRASREFTIGFVGRLVRDKAVNVLFRAAKHLTEREAVFRLHICGAGPCRAELVELTSQLGISDRVTWLSAVNPADVPSVMSEFDALVLPSRAAPGWKEQFGHVLVEAMAMGIPVVGAGSGAIPEVIGREDLIFAEEDDGGLANRLDRLMVDGAWRRQVSDYGRRRVLEQYTHDRVAEQLASFWADILHGSPGGDRQ